MATLRSGGALRDVAPTILDLLDLPRPAEMTGASLLIEDTFASAAQAESTLAG